MKTSFYFVVWILIYPFLGLFNNSFIGNNSFIIAFAIVWALTWLLNSMMPEILNYERISQIAPILEDVYTGNVSSFRKRLSRQAAVDSVTSIYFILSTVLITYTTFKVGGGVDDWIAMAVFLFFTVGAIMRSINLVKAKTRLHENPTPEQCMEIANNTYQMDYASYYEERNAASSYDAMLEPKPKYFKAFRIFSIVTAVIATLLGLLFIVSAIGLIIYDGIFGTKAMAGMIFLYGSLAAYFGIKDTLSCINKRAQE